MKKKLLAFTAAMVMTFTTMTAMAQSNMKVDITNAADKMVALKTDGTVKTMNYDVFNYSVLNSVENVKSIASEDYIGNTFFLLSNDGTVQAISKFSKSTFTGVEGWTGIQAIDAANDVVFGLTSEGTVKIAGSNASYFKAALDWKNIKSIFAKEDTLIGIDGEGKVYVASIMTDGKEISGWANMKKVVYDINSFWGITNDGQLVTTNSQFKVSTMKSGADLLGDFEDIDCMSGYATSGYYARILALKKDGRLIDITNYAEYTSKLATYSATVLSENVESFVTGATHYALVLKDGEVLSDKMSVPTTPDWILGIDIRYNGKYVDCDAA
ncbi:MAG: hypothetical protein Q8873_08205, partial [Bacillota bacterium]|nr:hypothetical protein [Bacillota bacterium]